MTTTLKLNLRGFSIVDGVPENWNQMETDKLTHSAGNIFSQFFSTLVTFFENLISSFKDVLPPPETRDEQIRRWLQVAGHYLIAAVVVILCIICFICFFSCFISIFSCLFTCISSTVGFLFTCISYTVGFLFGCIYSTVGFLFRGISSLINGCFSGIRVIWQFVMQCLGCGGRSAVVMMKAPGMPGTMIARTVFEANAQAYFAGLRALSR